MKETGLTPKQEKKLNILLQIIQQQSNLFLKQEPLLVKIPFETLKESSINKAEVRYFIHYLNENIGIIKPETLWINILNGTIAKYGDEIVSQVDQEIDPLSGVSLEDEEDSFILNIYNWKLFYKKAESFLGFKKESDIKQLEFLEDKNETKGITVYVNKEYGNPLKFNRGLYWKKIYELAKEAEVHYDKGFFDYFNSNQNNPLYGKGGFKLTQVLQKNGDYVVPNIKINLITQKKITQQPKFA